MNVKDIIILNLYEVKPLLLYILAILFITNIAFLVILLKSRKLWFDQKHFGVLSLFVELSPLTSAKLACAWIKCLTVWMYLVGFQKLEAIHFVFLAVPCVFIIILNRNFFAMMNHCINVGVQFVGVIAVNILCRYILQFEMKASYIIIYSLIATIIGLYSLYIFIAEVDFISRGRSVRLEKSKTEA